jgi:parallel beta-helix repeat protein
MLKRVSGWVSAMVWFFACAAMVSAATYYVDFAEGSNSADGLTPQTAWKHAPGDANATGGPKAVSLVGGDTIIFKGGVAYHGSISLKVSGEPGKPITLDGNTAGTFGSGRAVVDGGRVVQGWVRCSSAEEAEGNPRWRNIFYADLDLDIAVNFNHGEVVAHRQVPRDRQAPWQRIVLYDGESGLLPVSMHPKPKDPFYPDLPADFIVSETRLEVRDNETVLTDAKKLTQKDAKAFDGMFLGVHGGNNHVYFAAVTGYDPSANAVTFAKFTPTTYPVTRYAFYNSVKLIERPGEWSVRPAGPGKTRIYLLADRLEGGQPSNIGFPVFETGIAIDGGASHLRIQGLLVQRFSGGAGGVSVNRSSKRSKDITVRDCEIRFVSGHAGIGPNFCDQIVIEDCYVHHCPSWTTGIFINRVNDYRVVNCRLNKNSGSGIRHYECKRGLLSGNVILDHYGMHSSAINVYEGCEDLVLEKNYIQNTVAINRNAENIVFRHNVVDSQGKSPVAVAMWTSGRTGGTALKNLQFINNTFVNTNPSVAWGGGIFGQRGGGKSSPEGMVIRNNIVDGLRGDLPGQIENNLFTREGDRPLMGTGGQMVTDLNALFRDPANGDFRRKPGGPMMEAGADLGPPARQWKQ